MTRTILFVALLIIPVVESQACQRCGLFGLRCRFRAPVVYKQYVAPYIVPVVKQADVFVVQNNYPQPIAQQGTSVYGYQAAAQAYFVNPAQVLRQAAELSRAATATASLGINGFGQIAQTQLALQANITETLAKGQAASQVLGAAGLSQQTQAQQQSFALRIYQDETGAWKVEQATPAQQGIVAPQINSQMNPEVDVEIGRPSVLAQKCARCHGLNLAEPKGGVYLDANHKLSCQIVVKALKLIKSGEMPKVPEAPLTNDEKGHIFEELLSLEESTNAP